jgi:HEPN domain-containing protein
MTETDLIALWLKKAQSDMGTAIYCLNGTEQHLDAVCFHSQQAAEKVLKGFLVKQGIEPPKTHKMNDLCEMCMDCDSTFLQIYHACSALNSYAVQSRYPGNEPDIAPEEAQTALENAKTIYDFCKAKIENNLV